MIIEPITFSEWWNTIVIANSDAWVKILGFIPNFIGAVVTILIGLLVAYVLKWIVVQIASAIQLQTLSDKIKFSTILSKLGVKAEVSELLGNFVKWIVIIVFLIPALQVLGLSEVGEVLSQILGYLPKVVLAGFLVFIGIVVADIIAHAVKATALTLGSSTASVLATVAKYAIYVFIGLLTLEQLGVSSTLLLSAFTGIVAMIAIAGGLAFGLAGKDAAAELIKKIREEFSKK
jgi:hypothetical protein